MSINNIKQLRFIAYVRNKYGVLIGNFGEICVYKIFTVDTAIDNDDYVLLKSENNT